LPYILLKMHFIIIQSISKTHNSTGWPEIWMSRVESESKTGQDGSAKGKRRVGKVFAEEMISKMMGQPKLRAEQVGGAAETEASHLGGGAAAAAASPSKAGGVAAAAAAASPAKTGAKPGGVAAAAAAASPSKAGGVAAAAAASPATSPARRARAGSSRD
jgi:hypothetical protein